MNVIVAGTRTLRDRKLVFSRLDYYLSKVDRGNLVIFSGGDGEVKTWKTVGPVREPVLIEGADRLGEEWAHQNGIDYRVFPAAWKKYGRGAGPIRNETMAKRAHALICFWDGKSRGTQDMIERAKNHHLKVRIVRYKEK